MDERGQAKFESLLIVVTAVSIVTVGLAGFKARQPRHWNDLATAVSDITRDYSWQFDVFAAQWKNDPVASLKAAWRDAPTPDVSGVTLRPAPDPLAEMKALR